VVGCCWLVIGWLLSITINYSLKQIYHFLKLIGGNLYQLTTEVSTEFWNKKATRSRWLSWQPTAVCSKPFKALSNLIFDQSLSKLLKLEEACLHDNHFKKILINSKWVDVIMLQWRHRTRYGINIRMSEVFAPFMTSSYKRFVIMTTDDFIVGLIDGFLKLEVEDVDDVIVAIVRASRGWKHLNEVREKPLSWEEFEQQTDENETRQARSSCQRVLTLVCRATCDVISFFHRWRHLRHHTHVINH